MSPLAHSRAALALLAAVVAVAGPASAQSAAEREAQRLQGLLESYVGTPAPGDAATVTVAAQPGFYRVSLSLDRLARPLAAHGVAVDPAALEISIAPRPDGTWRLFDIAYPPLTIRAGERTTLISLDGTVYEGVFDPVVAFSRSVTFTAARLASESSGAGASSRSEARDYRVESGTVASGPETANTRATTTVRDVTQTMSLELPLPALPDGRLVITTASATQSLDVVLDEWKPRRILDLWAFLVAHAGPRLVPAKAELQSALSAALPLWRRLAVVGGADGFSVRSGFGEISAKHIGGGLRLGGLTRSSGLGLQLDASGLAVAGPNLPDWTKPLLPTDLALDADLTGFDLEAGARILIDGLEPESERPFPAEVADRAAGAALPANGFGLKVQPGRLKAAVYEVGWQADLTVGKDAISGRATVTAKGLDRAIAALKAGGPGTAAQATVGLYAAKALARREPDGTDVWVFTFDAKGRPLVNGKPLGGKG
ncbi:hypothetical protein [Prosthecomicrobium sp. N25]|uniref:hypothetical protein n=1 Tax=Prosthecomicrobium sp. N25 TaxID=3129254 RepID=UPI003076A341